MATGDSKTTRLLLEIVTDKASVASSKKAIEEVKTLLGETSTRQLTLVQTSKAVNKELAAIGREKSVQNIVKEYRDFLNTSDDVEMALQRVQEKLKAIGATDAEIKGVVRSVASVGAAADTGTTTGASAKSGKSSGLSKFGSELRALPAVPLGGGLSSDVVGKVINTLGRLGPAGLAAAAGIGAAVVAIKASTSEYERITKAIIASQKEYYTLLQTGTREQVQAAIEAKKNEIAILKAQVTENQRILGQFEKEAGGVGRAIADALDIGGVQNLRTNTQELEQQLQNSELALNRQVFALNSSEVATNTAIEAEKKLAAERTKVNLQLAAAYGDEAAFRVEAVAFTQEQIASQLDANNVTRARYEAELAYLKATGEQSDETSQRTAFLVGEIGRLGEKEQYLIQTALPLAMAREQEAKNAEDAAKKADILAKALEKVSDAKRKYADIETAYSDKLADIGANLDKALTTKLEAIDKAIADAQSSRADLVEKANSQLNEEERKAFLDREKLARDHEKAIKKIMRAGAHDSQQAIEDRDVVALSRAEQAQQDALDNENESYDERTLEIDQRLREQNRTVSIRLAEQLREVDTRLRQQTQAAITRYNEQVQVANQQTLAAKQAYQKQLSDLKAALTQDATIRNSGYTAMLNSAKTYGAGLAAIGAQMVNQLAAIKNQAAGMPTKTGGSKLPTPYAYGGNYRAGTLAKVQERYPGQRETFNGVPFPPGEGLFIGNRSGRISADGGAPVVNVMPGAVVVNGSGLNEVQLEARVMAGVEKGLTKFVEAL